MKRSRKKTDKILAKNTLVSFNGDVARGFRPNVKKV